MLTPPAIQPGSAAPGQTVNLPDYGWVQSELHNSKLTPAQKKYISQLPVTVIAPLTNQLHAPKSVDPVTDCQINMKDTFGLTVATDTNYYGFSDNGTKVTQVSSQANNIWDSNLYYPGADTLTFGQPGPPVAQMSVTDEFPIYTDLQTEYGIWNFHYELYGNGNWTCSTNW